MIRVSRSAIVTRKQCEMKRWHKYHRAGTGLTPVSVIGTLESQRGIAAHDLLAREAAGAAEWWTGLSDYFSSFPPEIARIQTAVAHRAVLGWLTVRKPILDLEWSLMSAEGEWAWRPRESELEIPFRMDRILRSKADGGLAIHDFKFIGSADLNWVRRHSHSDQTQLYIAGLIDRSGENVDGIIYDGIVIGKWDAKTGKQKGPMALGYERKDGSVSPKYIRGAPEVDLTQWDHSAWLRWIKEEDALNELYITTGLLKPSNDAINATVTATVGAETRWAQKLTTLELIKETFDLEEETEEFAHHLHALVERNPDQCLAYGWERACEYYDDCWLGGHPDGYRPTVDHHKEEE